jgi:hypothetical protein
VISFCANERFSVDRVVPLCDDASSIRRISGVSVACRTQKRGHQLIWDFLQRYDDSWIWRCADRHHVSESTRNFAALEECVEDAARHGYVAAPAPAPSRSRNAQAAYRSRRMRKSAGPDKS